ncbi:hypothetical protein SCMU_33580 [Sinomonas cyclohexanicum]|uniref:Uncharacterized protein n=1 Tax=Sinomonas cyclohexanicum TaxID=322009 RepID=A0ABM7PYY6_SINCY|nr:hypothetical protein [Corynebacterium cyclohexanicum]BCT77516.1 hypothetical protein SCMU_33580 [Corynebacterium cyclohexanicum]
MSITTTITRPSAGEAAVLPQPAERYIPKVTNIDPDIAVRTDRHEGKGGWAARVPVLNWFVAR